MPKPVISGGEEDLANLVLRLAISQMIAERSGQPFSLLMLDEVFGSLDETRRQNVVELLRALQRSLRAGDRHHAHRRRARRARPGLRVGIDEKSGASRRDARRRRAGGRRGRPARSWPPAGPETLSGRVSAALKPGPRGLRERGSSARTSRRSTSVFSDAFSDRYRRDGLAGVRVPPLNPAIWRYAIEDAGDGAMLLAQRSWTAIVAFNIAHQSGTEGWMGPLAVRPELQGRGLGTADRRAAAIEFLRSRGCTVIGLETMPRTMDNIGFYSRLGFVPGADDGHVHVRGEADALLAAVAAGRGSSADGGDRECCARWCSGCSPASISRARCSSRARSGIGDTVLLRRRRWRGGVRALS